MCSTPVVVCSGARVFSCAVPDVYADESVYGQRGVRDDEDGVPRADGVDGKAHGDDELPYKKPLRHALARALLPLFVDLFDERRAANTSSPSR